MDLENVFRDTLNIIKNIPQDPSVRYRGLLRSRNSYTTNTKNTIIDVKNCDCIDVCSQIIFLYPTRRVGLLNMASDLSPGGGVVKGARAQEEDICRRSSLYPTLARQRYPFACDEALFTPDVKIVKRRDYSRCNHYQNISGIVSAAALRRPVLDGLGKLQQRDYDLLKNKVRMVLEIFEHHEIDHVVLGAWGCGAFRNPPRQVAEIFRETLKDFSFSHVTFAISTPREKDRENLIEFTNVFYESK